MLYLHALGHAHPATEITNRVLEDLDIGTDEAWILERVGIRVRRSVLPLDYIRETRNSDVRAAAEAATTSSVDLAERAARRALEGARCDPALVGLVISGSNAPESLCPAEACRLAERLRIQATAYDVNAACSSFVATLALLDAMRPERLPDFVLVTATETLTTAVDYSDRASAVLFGDGSAAALVSPRVPGPAEIHGAHAAADPSGADRIRIRRTGTFSQDGRQVQRFAIRRTAMDFAEIEKRYRDPRRRLHLVGHQANLRALEKAAALCDIEPALHHTNVETRGNTGAAGCPSVVSMNWSRFGPGDDVALTTVGAGLSWARALLRFREAA